jgi:protoporphyrinogen/coproporphyrinogen III oxidase
VAKIAIVGAGISGLACAWHLESLLPDVTVDVLEATDSVGGVIQTHYEAPFLVELGADNIASLIPDGAALVDKMGIRKEFASPNPDHRFAQVVRSGRIYPIPNGFSLMQPTKMGAILVSPILSLRGKIRVLWEYFVPRRTLTVDESVESFAVRRLGRECFDRLVEPIVGGIFTARAETLSMQASMPQFVEMERENGGLIRGALAKRKSESQSDSSARKATGARYDQFIAPAQGMSWWMNQIAAQLRQPVHLGVKVCRVSRRESGGWRVDCNKASIAETVYDSVCLATPSWVTAKLIETENREASELLERIPYASSAIGVLAVRKSEIRPDAMCFGIVVPKTEQRDSLAISLSSEKYKGRCPDDLVLARVFMGGAVRPELLNKSDDELLDLAYREVQQLLGITSKPVWQKLVRWNQAMPQYMTGHLELTRKIREHLARSPNLHAIGNAFDGVGIPQCIRLARQTANAIAKNIATLMIAMVLGLSLCQGLAYSACSQEAAIGSASKMSDELIRQAFLDMHDGWSVDEVLLDDGRRQAFLKRIHELLDEGSRDEAKPTDKELFERLVQLRKGNKLQIKSTKSQTSDVSDYLVGAEIASRLMHDRYGVSSDQWLVDPELLAKFDEIGLPIVGDSNSYLLRKAALKLRKSRSLRPELLQRVTDWHVTIQEMPLTEAAESLSQIPESPGVYIFRDRTGYLYIGQASNLRSRLKKHLTDSDRKALSHYLSEDTSDSLTLELHVFGPDSPAKETVAREAYESELIRSRKPKLNVAP